MKKDQHKTPLEQPELPNMPPKPPQTTRVYRVTLIEGKKKIYCKVDYEGKDHTEEMGEIFATVRKLENILNQLKKQNINLLHQSYEQHYNHPDNTINTAS